MKNFDQINVFVDCVIFTIKDNKVHTLVGKRNKEPFNGSLSLIGGHHKKDFNSENCAKIHLKEKINFTPRNIEKFNWSSEAFQDPRGPSVALAHLILANEKDIEKIQNNPKEFSELLWIPIDEIDYYSFGFAHHKNFIIEAINRLETKVKYTKAGFELLNEKFTIEDISKSFECIVNKKIDTSNLLKKLRSLNLIIDTREKRKNGSTGKKPTLYRLNQKGFRSLSDTTSLFK